MTLLFAIGFGALNDGDILAPAAGKGKWSNFALFSLYESRFDHIIPNVNKGKSLRTVFGQDPLICHRFRSSQRW